MQKTCTRRVAAACIAMLMAASTTRALDPVAANGLAATAISSLGRTRGFVSLPRCGDGELARAFLQNSSMKVHAMDDERAIVLGVDTRMADLGFAAPRVYVDQGTLLALPYADRFVDCIVVTNLTDTDLSSVPYAEVERVLCPEGKAWIGRATAEGTGLTADALQGWIDAAAREHSSAAVSTGDGVWAVITRRELSGTDVWPRHSYDTRGSRYSKDSVAAFPWLPQAKLKPYHGDNGTVVTSGGRMYMAFPDMMSFSPTVNWLRAYSIYNGELLWTRDLSADNLGDMAGDPIVAYGPDLYLNRRSGGILQLDGLTGAEKGVVASVPSDPASVVPFPSTPMSISGCGPLTASINAVYQSPGVYGYDFEAGAQRAAHFYKVPCRTMGVVVSNGLIINAASKCNCGCSRLRGTHLDAAAGSFQFDRAAAPGGTDRLEQVLAPDEVAVQVSPDPSDWPTHRANNARNAATPVSVGTSAGDVHLMWNYRPSVAYVTQPSSGNYEYTPEQEPTPPAVAGRFTFFGGTDAFVRCVDNRSGTLAWSYRTGGRIRATPTVWNGRVYVGSEDGYAYCFEAHTGRLAWRFRAAPVDRRMSLYGYLASMWPVLTGVMVHNGNAYFAAGMQSEYGSHMYCVDAETGALVWQHNTGATWMNTFDRLGFTPCGYMAVASQRVIVANSVGSNVSFDLASGAMDPMPPWLQGDIGVRNGYPADCTNRGREVGVVGDMVLTGGEHIFRDHSWRSGVGLWSMYTGLNKLNAAGVTQYPKIAFSRINLITPTWDDQDFFMCMSGARRLEKFSVADVSQKVAAKIVEIGPTPRLAINQDAMNEPGMDDRHPWWPTDQWARKDIVLSGMALAANAVVATYAKTAVTVPENAVWFLGVLDRSNGATRWEVQLPDVGPGLKGEPLWHGIAIDRNGYIILAQRNGNVLCYGGGATSVAAVRPECRPVANPAPGAPVAGFEWAPYAGEPLTGRGSGCVVLTQRGLELRAHDPVSSGPGAAALAMIALSTEEPTDPVPVIYNPIIDSSAEVEVVDGVRMRREPPGTHDMAWAPEAECIGVDSVTADASEAGFLPENTVDRLLTSRWTPTPGELRRITYDLGSSREVASATLVWYSRHQSGTPFAIEVSADGERYTRVDEGSLVGRGTHASVRSFLPEMARFVRVVLDLRDAAGSPSLYEVGIHPPVVGLDQATANR